MKQKIKILNYFFLLLIIVFSKNCFAKELFIDKEKIEQTLGIKGNWYDLEKVFKITFPRNDVKVVVDEWPLSPFMGLTSWISFTNIKDSLIAMGDMVLFEDEVNSVIKVALANGLFITALHNHFFFDSPKVYFMHIHGSGSAEKLSSSIKSCFDQIKFIRKNHPVPATNFNGISIPSKSSISKEIVQGIFGTDCQEQNGMVKVIWGRNVKMNGIIGKEMGINCGAAFGGSNDKAVVDGDIVVPEEDLQSVIKTLQDVNINIVAIHNHLIHETPRMIFIHFWGKGTVRDLAQGMKNAFDAAMPAELSPEIR